MRVAENNPYGEAARFLINFGQGVDDIARGWSPESGVANFGVGALGRGLLADGVSAFVYRTNPVEIQYQATTLVVVSQSIEGGNNGYVLTRSMGSGTPSWGLGTHRGSLNGWTVAVNAGSDFILSPHADIGAAAASAPVCQVFSIGGGLARLTVNGQLAVSGAYTGSIDYSRTYQGQGIRILREWAGGTTSFRGLVYACGVLEGALSDAAAAELSLNPWQLFRADPIRIYSLPTGAISINSITASNITQTGARITLGLTR